MKNNVVHPNCVRTLFGAIALIAAMTVAEPAIAGSAQSAAMKDAPIVALPKQSLEDRGLTLDPAGLPKPLERPKSGEQMPSVWQRTLYKTLTYQTGTNIMDLALFTALIGGAAGSGSSFLMINAVSAAGLYYGFEYGWTASEDPAAEKTTGDMASKAIIYRVANAGRNLALGFAFGGAAAASTAFMVANTATDTAVYIGNEYLWDMVYPNAVKDEAILVATTPQQ